MWPRTYCGAVRPSTGSTVSTTPGDGARLQAGDHGSSVRRGVGQGRPVDRGRLRSKRSQCPSIGGRGPATVSAMAEATSRVCDHCGAPRRELVDGFCPFCKTRPFAVGGGTGVAPTSYAVVLLDAGDRK